MLPTGVWFLKRHLDQWRILPARGGRELGPKNLYHPARLEDIKVLGAGLTEDDLVLAVATELIRSGEHPLFMREVLDSHDSPSIRGFLAQMSQSEQAQISMVGFSELLRRGDVAALTRLKEQESVILNAANNYGQLALQAIKVDFRNPHAAALRTLGALANDRSVDMGIREAVAHALSMIHTRDAVPYLAALLDEDDVRLTRCGAIGLGFFVHGVGAQTAADGPAMKHLNFRSPTPYESEETRQYFGFDETRAGEFVAFWKNWWLVHQGEFR